MFIMVEELAFSESLVCQNIYLVHKSQVRNYTSVFFWFLPGLMFSCYSPDGNLETWGVTMEHKPEQEPDGKLNYASDKPKFPPLSKSELLKKLEPMLQQEL